MIENKAEYVDLETAAPSHSKKPDGTAESDHGIIVAVGIPSIPVRLAPSKSYLVAS
jgi:hypothetical protein